VIRHLLLLFALALGQAVLTVALTVFVFGSGMSRFGTGDPALAYPALPFITQLSDDAAVGLPWGTPGVLGKRPGLGGGYSRAAAIVAPAQCPGALKVTGRTTPTCRSWGSSND